MMRNLHIEQRRRQSNQDENELSITDLESRNISPQRYKHWFSMIEPRHRSLANRLVLQISYFSEQEIREKMETRCEEILRLAQGKNIYWSSVARRYDPKNFSIEGNKFWDPSGVQITLLFVDFFKKMGFKEYDPQKDPLYKQFLAQKRSLPTMKKRGPFVLTKVGPINDANQEESIDSVFCYKEYRYDSEHWDFSNYPALFLLEKGTQRIALTCEFREVNILAISSFLLRHMSHTVGTKVGVVAFGDDWTLGASEKSNVAQHMLDAYRGAQFLFDEQTKLVFSYGYATQQATKRLEAVIAQLPNNLSQTFQDRFPDKNRIIILHKPEQPVPIVSDFFDPPEVRTLSQMVRDIYNDRGSDFFIQRTSRAVLTHTALSVPDNMHDLLFLGPDANNSYPLIIHPKNKT